MPNPLSLRGPARQRRRVRPRHRVLLFGTVFVTIIAMTAPAVAAPKFGRGSFGVVPYSAGLTRAPFGELDTPTTGRTGIRVTGWAVDPDATSAVIVDVTVDGHRQPAATANLASPTQASLYPGYGTRHGFSVGTETASGTHTVCATVRNVASGPSSVSLGCRRVSVTVSPFGAINSAALTYGGVQVTGWAADTDTTGPLRVTVTVDGDAAPAVVANRLRTDVGRSHPVVGSAHGFLVSVGGLAQGRHTVCMTAQNVGAGATPATIACTTADLNFNPVGRFDPIPRPAGSKAIPLHGYAVDPDTSKPLTLTSSIDGRPGPTFAADKTMAGYRSPFTWVGGVHGYSVSVPVDNAAHTVCLTVKNYWRGSDSSLGCRTSAPMTATAPTNPAAAYATPGTAQARVVWSAPRSSGGAPITGYSITINQGSYHHTVPAPLNSRNVLLTKLGPGATTFSVVARNVVGSSKPYVTRAVSIKASPYSPQTTPPLISTSRYIRNISGAADDIKKTYAMGVSDAANNPSGHRYLILLQIGGQNTTGVVLSATSQYVSYANTVRALKAYLDGYSTRQGRTAPAMIAVGTNNDMDVRATTGSLWATQIVNPLWNYAKRYPNISIAGANDIEPGFIGSPAGSQAWVKAFLQNTPAKFVFNGSADGCNWNAPNGGCNNGWSANVLHWVSGGVSPTRVLSLPQIYNTTMSKQWKYISLTGVLNGRPRINFAGPLTEWTACYAQGYGCGSLPNSAAWKAMWADLRSDSRVAQSGLPFGTDLRVN